MDGRALLFRWKEWSSNIRLRFLFFTEEEATYSSNFESPIRVLKGLTNESGRLTLQIDKSAALPDLWDAQQGRIVALRSGATQKDMMVATRVDRSADSSEGS